MNNLLYSIIDINSLPGGPKTRISSFKNVFEKKGDTIIIGKNKIRKSLRAKNINIIYVESATNRIRAIDFICLFILKLKSKKTIVFIRDIYIELFPNHYKGIRGSISKISNKISNLYLTLISSKMVFPTIAMGEIFFQRNKLFPRKEFTDLPPGTIKNKIRRRLPDFDKKLGVLYLGSTRYKNSGFNYFLDFADKYHNEYDFHILSKDNLSFISNKLRISYCEREDISKYIEDNNIAYAVHTRPRNQYDDITFPIKILDFISLELPFFTERHIPIINMMGTDYKLYVDYNNIDNLNFIISNISMIEYNIIADFLHSISSNNTYDIRYNKLIKL